MSCNLIGLADGIRRHGGRSEVVGFVKWIRLAWRLWGGMRVSCNLIGLADGIRRHCGQSEIVGFVNGT
jgi:hypothetical protein